ncbi:MAG TPA: FAD-dependent oxidoreductase, partial [Sulfitobacter sp.]|nr:FAD-dependent oxidoreductase [Sulfitobacter sp.]
WSGMVCLSRAQMPFVGKLPDPGAVYASLCYHGNGVAMGSYSGGLVADLVMGKPIDRPYPQVMQKPLRKFELGRLRRLLMPFAYLGFALSDH